MSLRQIQPLAGPSPQEIPLPRAPLERVIFQVKFPSILAIGNPDRVATFQEAIRDQYPHLLEEAVQNVTIEMVGAPRLSQSKIWRFMDRKDRHGWRISLGVEFLAVETTAYLSRSQFIERISLILESLQEAFKPAQAERIGLRYINRIKDDALGEVENILQPGVLGILQPQDGSVGRLGGAALQVLTEAQLMAAEGRVQLRWGSLPPNTSYDPESVAPIRDRSWVLDLDMYVMSQKKFAAGEISETVRSFAARLYEVFRSMVQERFLKHYGEEP